MTFWTASAPSMAESSVRLAASAALHARPDRRGSISVLVFSTSWVAASTSRAWLVAPAAMLCEDWADLVDRLGGLADLAGDLADQALQRFEQAVEGVEKVALGQISHPRLPPPHPGEPSTEPAPAAFDSPRAAAAEKARPEAGAA